MREKKRRPIQGCELSRRWLVRESKYKELPHGTDLGVKAEASFGSGSWLGKRSSHRELARPGLGCPSGARGRRCPRLRQGSVSKSLQSWGDGTQAGHKETLRISPLLSGGPVLVERSW